jgi:hypothetical protein
VPYLVAVRLDLGWDGWETTLELSTDGHHARVMIHSPHGFPEKLSTWHRDDPGDVNDWVVLMEEICVGIAHISRHLKTGAPTGTRCGIPHDQYTDLDELVGSVYPDPREFDP